MIRKPDGAGDLTGHATSWSEWDRDLHNHLPVGAVMSDAFFELLSRVVGAALARATLGLVLCLALAAVSRNGAQGVLPAVALVYSMMGTLMLSWGLRAEKQKRPNRGGQLLCVTTSLRELCVAACFGACGSEWVSLCCGQAADGS